MNKLVALLISLMIAASGVALAQAPATPAAGGTTQAAPNAQQQPAAPATTAPPGKHQPVAKTPEEYKAYQEASAKPDGPSAEAAADAFAQQYPQSELRGALYQHVMILYQNANNSDKTIEMGRKTLSVEPDNAPALAIVASTLANRTRESDLDRDERLAEAKKDATRAIELANSGEAVPAGTPPAQAGPYKDTLLSMAYAALGAIDFDNKDYPSAEQNLKKSVQPSQAEPDPISWYQLALTLQREGKNPDALNASQKCVEVSGSSSPQVANICKNLQTYLEKLVNNPPAKPATPAAPASAPTATPQSK